MWCPHVLTLLHVFAMSWSGTTQKKIGTSPLGGVMDNVRGLSPTMAALSLGDAGTALSASGNGAAQTAGGDTANSDAVRGQPKGKRARGGRGSDPGWLPCNPSAERLRDRVRVQSD